jgi:hypothetical protein
VWVGGGEVIVSKERLGPHPHSPTLIQAPVIEDNVWNPETPPYVGVTNTLSCLVHITDINSHHTHC